MKNFGHLLVRIAACLAVYFALVPVAHSANINFSSEVSRESTNELIAKAASAYAAGDRNITITLDSGGGDLQAALHANSVLKTYGVNTNVRNDCSSACTVLFAAGARRSASSGATFLFHAVQAAKAPKAKKGLFDHLTKQQRQSAVNAFSDRWLAAVRATSPSLASYLNEHHILTKGERTFTGRQLQSFGYVND